MKLFKNLLSSIKPHFEKGGKLENFYPAYDAFETFLICPGSYYSLRVLILKMLLILKRTMAFVVLAMLPCILFGMWNIGSQYYLALS